MIDDQRHLFDIPDGVTFLNCASRSPLTTAAIAVGEAAVTRRLRPWDRVAEEVTQTAEGVRGLFAGMIGAEADDIAIVPAASYGVATAALNLPVAAGQTILVPEEPFPSNFFTWRDLARERGARIETVPEPADGDWTAAINARIGADTAIAAMPACRWTDGAVVDAEAIGARCRETGTAFVLDATQSVGAMALDVGRMRPDFLIASGYKWLFCPYTLGFLYAAPERQDGRALEGHMYNRLDAVAFDGSTRYPEEGAPGARRYDMGQVFNDIHLPMAAASMEQITAWTPAAIAETLRPLTDRIAEAGAERGFTAPSAEHRVGHYIGLRRPGGFAASLGPALAAERVYISIRSGTLRVSPHLFNSAGDIDRLFETLDRLA